jgi:hypothetical protein
MCKKIVSSLVLGVVFLGANSVKAKDVLAKEGKAEFDIVVQKNAPEPVVFAGEELKTFLNMITGADFKITDKMPEKGHAIVLGDCPAARKVGIDVNKIKRDGYVIKSIGGNIYIAGKDDSGEKADIKKKLEEVKKASFMKKRVIMNEAHWNFERGTLYGAYRFLEELGVRWFFPGSKGMVVPENKELAIEAVDIKEEPYFEYRSVGSSTKTPFAFLKKSSIAKVDPEEFKELEWTAENNILWGLRQRGSSTLLPLNHRPHSVGMVERFAKSHPEYFALLDNGKRDLDPGNRRYRSHLCYSNPEVMNIAIEDIEAYQKGQSAASRGVPKKITDRHQINNGWHSSVFYGNIFSLLPHDSFRACHCEKCKGMINKNPDEYGRTNSKQVWTFVDKCARELKKRKNDAKVTCLAYSSYCFPYKGMKKLPDNVIVGMCPAYLNKPYMLADEAQFKKWEKLVESWDDLTEVPLAYWEHCLYRWRRPQFYAVPLHIPHLRDKVFKKMAKHGKWAYIQTMEDSVLFEHFHRYAMLKTFYDPNINIDDLFNDYIEKFYGPKAGPIVKSIYEDIEKRDLEMLKNNSGRIEIWEKYFTPEVLKEYRRKADEAVKLAQGSKYETAAKLFSKYYVGLMEKGNAAFDKHVRKVLNSSGAKSCICAVRDRGPMKIDGVLDEKAWEKPTRTLRLGNNVNGKRTEWPTEVKLLRSPDKLYFAFVCHDPDTMKRSMKKGEAENVEIFLDPQHDHDSYYQIMIDMAGRVEDIFYEGGGERGQKAWNSGSEVAIKKHDDRWIVEVAVPRANMNDGLKRPATHPWGANFCRSMRNPPKPEDTFSRWSPLLLGGFHQPDLFGHIIFQN